MTPRAKKGIRIGLCAALWLISTEEKLLAQTDKPGPKPAIRHQTHDSRSSLDSIYTQIARGDLLGAEQALHNIMRQYPEQIDAMLALAGLYQLQGDQAQSAMWRLRARTQAPEHDETLATQTYDTAAGLPSEQAETQLRTYLAHRPGASPLHFALGNQLAEQGRWHEAHLAYTQALRGDSNNPDYRYNLAVSLDRLHQSQLARHHYRLAQQHRQSRPAFFSSQTLQQRLNELDHD